MKYIFIILILLNALKINAQADIMSKINMKNNTNNL